MLLIGLISGTSADGIDAALVEIDGWGRQTRIRVRAGICLAFRDAERDAIFELCETGAASAADVCAADAMLGERLADAAVAVCERAGISIDDVDAIASHGQTIWHQPRPREFAGRSVRGSLQIGCPAVIAGRTGRAVVSGFRQADMALGGQGAPLVPYADWALLTSDDETRVVQNIGGIANATYLPSSGSLDRVVAFDTGPGNMVIDGVVRAVTGGALSLDADGRLARAGNVDQGLLAALLGHPFFAMPPPRSTGREEFGAAYVAELLGEGRRRGLGHADLVATATALTVESIAMAHRRYLAPRGQIDTVIVGGGGARSPTLMAMLADRLKPARLTTHEEFGIDGDAKEAIAFALLGYETLCGRPSSVPSVTGASRAAILGSITRV